MSGIGKGRIRQMRKEGIPEEKIQEIVVKGDDKAAKQAISLLRMIKKREKGPFMTLEKAAEELGIEVR